jgi:hypothetical protein
MRRLFLLSFIFFFLAGCTALQYMGIGAPMPTLPPTVSIPTPFQPSGQQVPPANAAQSVVQVQTTLQPTNRVQPTATPNSSTSPSSLAAIVISAVQNGGEAGTANVLWNVSGEFPNGFKVVWSETNSSPSFPGDNNQYVDSPAARSAIIRATAGKTYYFRVCRYTGSGCDSYSNSVQFKLASVTAPTSTKTVEWIAITDVQEVGIGEARVSWEASGNFSKGFKVVWSDRTQTPTYPENSAIFVAENNTWSAVVTGDPGTNYYIRVCKYNGSSCVFYSSVYNFTFTKVAVPTAIPPATIRITSMTDKVVGFAYINWDASGYLPSGFKIAYSETNPNPIYPGDSAVYINDSAARSAVVEGVPTHTYYYRICQYLGGVCGSYSNAYTYTFPPDYSTISITSITTSPLGPDMADVSWTATGLFSDGFNIVWSDTNPTPTYPADSYTFADSSARSGSIGILASGVTYHVRVCKFAFVTAGTFKGFAFFKPNRSMTGTWNCTIYSGVTDYTAP